MGQKNQSDYSLVCNLFRQAVFKFCTDNKMVVGCDKPDFVYSKGQNNVTIDVRGPQNIKPLCKLLADCRVLRESYLLRKHNFCKLQARLKYEAMLEFCRRVGMPKADIKAAEKQTKNIRSLRSAEYEKVALKKVLNILQSSRLPEGAARKIWLGVGKELFCNEPDLVTD